MEELFCTFEHHCSRSIITILLCYFVSKKASYLIHFQKIQCKGYYFLFKTIKFTITNHCFILLQEKTCAMTTLCHNCEANLQTSLAKMEVYSQTKC